MRVDYPITPLSVMIEDNENILWHAKPYMPCFILESIFNPLAPFALLWLLIDSIIIFLFASGSSSEGWNYETIFFIIFFLIHLMPVWIYLAGILLSFNKYKNTEFFITDKAVYASGGMFHMFCDRKEYKNIKEISIERGFVDKMLGVGDVVLKDANDIKRASSNSRIVALNISGLSICDMHDYIEVYEMLNDLKNQVL